MHVMQPGALGIFRYTSTIKRITIQPANLTFPTFVLSSLLFPAWPGCLFIPSFAFIAHIYFYFLSFLNTFQFSDSPHLKMFAKLFKVLAAASVVASVVSTPLPSTSELEARYISFNNYHGDRSMSNFDSFYGSDNFSGEISKTVVVKQEQELVCHSESITIIQQRLLVLQEMAKRIITEQVCDVESQTVVFEQFYSSLGSFSGDLRRQSGRSVGYDSSIASHFSSIVSSSGSLSSNNFGFSGSSVGSHYVVPEGSNWNDATSPASVGSAYSAAQAAISSS